MELALGAAAAVVAAVVAFAVGRSSGSGDAKDSATRAAASAEQRIRAVAAAVARGELPAVSEPASAEADLKRALESGWAPRGVEHQRALREALSRVGGFLTRQVREPLAGAGPDAGRDELRERIDRALGSLEDLEFYLEEPDLTAQGQNLSSLAQQVTREFAKDQGVLVRLKMEGPVRASVNAQGFMDALYLVLHNAARFDTEGSVDVTIATSDGRASVRVRDRGPGFSDADLKRAFDPFYSTTDDGLGLGLPHARKTLEAMGGRIELRNAPDGGAEVEVSFPTS